MEDKEWRICRMEWICDTNLVICSLILYLNVGKS